MAEPRSSGSWGWRARARAPRHVGVAVAPGGLWMWRSCARTPGFRFLSSAPLRVGKREKRPRGRSQIMFQAPVRTV
jgi:hypothetical protein